MNSCRGRWSLAAPLVVALGLALLAACSGGPKELPSPATVGGPDQTETVVVTSPIGVTVTVPPGASPEPITIAIAPAPAGTTVPAAIGNAIGPIVEITPHGTTFAEPVTVRVPIDVARVPADGQLVVLKAEPGGPWVVHTDVTRVGESLEVPLYGFSRLATAAFAETVRLLVEPVELGKFGGAPFFESNRAAPRPAPLPIQVTLVGKPAGCVIRVQDVNRWDLAQAWPASPGVFVLPMGISPWGRNEWHVSLSSGAFGPHQSGDRRFGRTVRGRLDCTRPVNGMITSFSIEGETFVTARASFPSNRIGFTREPEATTAVAGERAGFSVHVVGGTADEFVLNEILWLRSDDGGDSWQPMAYNVPAPDNQDGLYTDDELNWYHTPPVTAADDGALFRVRACATGPTLPAPQVQNDCQFSEVAKLTVIADAAPAFTSTSGDQTVDSGQVATFSAVVTGIPTPTLQWQSWPARTGVLGDIAGATGSSYQTPPAALEPVADRYRLVATNRAGTATAPWMSLFVRPPASPPSITAQPLPATVLRGGSASFTVTASGTAPLAYQWRHDGVAVPGATLPTFDLVAATAADAGSYSVAVSNVAGSVTSADALLTVLLATFTVGGTVNGLTGSGLVLKNNGADALPIYAGGPFTFATPVADGSSYAVTVFTQPIGQACTVTGGTGVATLADVTSVVVTCAARVAPTVVATAPTDGATWIPTDDPVAIDFSTAMDPATLTGATVTLLGPAGPVAGVVAAAGVRATFTPSAPLCNPCAFTAAVSTAARALDGTALAAAASLSFSTGKVPVQAASRLAAAGIHTLAIPPDLSAWTWGTNTAGALGNGGADGAVSLQPVQAVGLPALKSIDGAAWYSIALAGDGTVWGWGWGPSIGVASSRPLPAPIEGLTGITAISAGYRHGLALRSDGGVMGWGFEDPFVLSPLTGTYAARQLTGLADIVAVAAGENFSLALRSDGVVLAWGAGTFGQLGDGLASSRATPARVPGLTGVLAIATESFTGLALRYDATVWGWGHNAEGEAGVGSSAAVQPIPALVASGAVAIATGNYHALALLADGTVQSWGYNKNGRLGDGTISDRIAPVAVAGLSGVIEVSGGEFHSAARTGDGAVWTWGDNSRAQLGDGTQTERWVPVQVPGLAMVAALIAVGTPGSPGP